MKGKQFFGFFLGACMAAGLSFASFGASGTWKTAEGDYYYYDAAGNMMTGWQKIGNLYYYFYDNGIMALGWQFCPETGAWYYYDINHSVHTGWLLDDGKWYWLVPDGAMNTQSPKVIDREEYYFHEDGSLYASEYMGFQYFDWQGRPDPEYDVRIEGDAASVTEEKKAEIGKELSRIPKGWIKKFSDDGWTWMYCPDTDWFSMAMSENGEPYYFRYKIDTGNQVIRFSDEGAVHMAFGEYMYRAEWERLNAGRFQSEAAWNPEGVRRVTGLPKKYEKEYGTVFGALFSVYLEEGGKEKIAGELPYLAWLMEVMEEGRGLDGKPAGVTF